MELKGGDGKIEEFLEEIGTDGRDELKRYLGKEMEEEIQNLKVQVKNYKDGQKYEQDEK